MATAGSERLRGPDTAAPPAAAEPPPPGPSPGPGPGPSPGETHRHRDPGGGGGGGGGGWEQRPRRRTDPGRSSGRAGRRASGSRGGDFLCPPLFKPSESVRVRQDEREEQGVLSDSENEEPLSRRIRNISAFIRKTSTALSSGGQRSRSCTDPVEEKLKVVLQPALDDSVGAAHSLTAGILLSSENSRSVSVPILPSLRRLAWSAVVPPQFSVGQSERCVPAPLGQSERCVPAPLGQSERSVSPDSNDSISEELNHFKPIVCSPCTPPKRLADGRVLEPRIVKSTPRNLRELGHRSAQSSWYQTSAAVLQKWRQIELDRLKVSAATQDGRCPVSVATLTSPVSTATSPVNDSAAATRNRRRLRFDSEETVRIRVPAIHPQDQSLDGLGFRSTSKRKNKPRATEAKRSRRDANAGANPCANANSNRKDNVKANAKVSTQERADRALALRLQRRFDSESAVSDPYFLRSANQSADGGRGLRSRWTNRSSDGGRGLRSRWTNRSADRRSSGRSHKRP